MIVATSSSNGTESIAVLQKEDPDVTFTAADVTGFGGGGGGSGTNARRFVYNQISSGSSQEWEFAMGRIGSDRQAQYTPAAPPVNVKVTELAIDADGIVSETAVAGQNPPVLVTHGVMSSDKTVIVATATDTDDADGDAAAPKYVLRIFGFINLGSGCPPTLTSDRYTDFALADLSGTHRVRALLVPASAGTSLSASGTVQIDDAGLAHFTEYADSGGGTAPPDVTLSMPTSATCGAEVLDGLVESAGDASLHGKLSFHKDMLVLTADGAGISSLSIGLK
jgi:hypothetical protein